LASAADDDEGSAISSLAISRNMGCSA